MPDNYVEDPSSVPSVGLQDSLEPVAFPGAGVGAIDPDPSRHDPHTPENTVKALRAQGIPDEMIGSMAVGNGMAAIRAPDGTIGYTEIENLSKAADKGFKLVKQEDYDQHRAKVEQKEQYGGRGAEAAGNSFSSVYTMGISDAATKASLGGGAPTDYHQNLALGNDTLNQIQAQSDPAAFNDKLRDYAVDTGKRQEVDTRYREYKEGLSSQNRGASIAGGLAGVLAPSGAAGLATGAGRAVQGIVTGSKLAGIASKVGTEAAIFAVEQSVEQAQIADRPLMVSSVMANMGENFLLNLLVGGTFTAGAGLLGKLVSSSRNASRVAQNLLDVVPGETPAETLERSYKTAQEVSDKNAPGALRNLQEAIKNNDAAKVNSSLAEQGYSAARDEAMTSSPRYDIDEKAVHQDAFTHADMKIRDIVTHLPEDRMVPGQEELARGFEKDPLQPMRDQFKVERSDTVSPRPAEMGEFPRGLDARLRDAGLSPEEISGMSKDQKDDYFKAPSRETIPPEIHAETVSELRKITDEKLDGMTPGQVETMHGVAAKLVQRNPVKLSDRALGALDALKIEEPTKFGTLYRGTSMTQAELDALSVGAKHSFGYEAPTSYNSDLASMYADEALGARVVHARPGGVEDRVPVLFRIRKADSGYSMVSDRLSKDLNEILIPHDAGFKVVGRSVEDGRNVIDLVSEERQPVAGNETGAATPKAKREKASGVEELNPISRAKRAIMGSDGLASDQNLNVLIQMLKKDPRVPEDTVSELEKYISIRKDAYEAQQSIPSLQEKTASSAYGQKNAASQAYDTASQGQAVAQGIGGAVSDFAEKYKPPEFYGPKEVPGLVGAAPGPAKGILGLMAQSAGRGVGWTAGHAVGGGMFGGLAAAHYFGNAAKKLIDVNTAFGQLLRKGVASIGIASSKGAQVATAAGIKATRAGIISGPFGADKNKTYQRQAAEAIDNLTLAANNPAALEGRMQDALTGLRSIDPKLADAVFKQVSDSAKYIADKAPKPPEQGQSILPQFKWQPTDAEVSAFSHTLEAAQNPLVIIDQINRGTIMPETIDAVEKLHPDVAQAVKEEIILHLTEVKELPYKSRLALYQWMGLPLDPTLTPMFAEGMKAVWATKPNEPKKSGGFTAPTNPQKLASPYATQTSKFQ